MRSYIAEAVREKLYRRIVLNTGLLWYMMQTRKDSCLQGMAVGWKVWSSQYKIMPDLTLPAHRHYTLTLYSFLQYTEWIKTMEKEGHIDETLKFSWYLLILFF